MLASLPLALALLSCKDKGRDDTAAPADDTGAAWRPDLVCPGDPGCVSGAGELQAGAAAVAITPPCFEGWEDADGNATYSASSEVFHDCGCDRLCEGDEGWPGPDEGEGDGEFQAVWLAGFGQARAANGVHDDLWARVVVLRQGEVTVAVVALDVVGWFYDDTLAIRRAVTDAGLDVDHVIVHATHQHEGPDTMGQWGPNLTHAGTDRAYMDQVVAWSAQAIGQALDGIQPVTLRAGTIDTAAPFGDKGTRNTVRDSRDPVIIDEFLSVAQLDGLDGSPVATLVNWSNHPEAVGSDNLLITSDFAHYLRTYVEQGVGGRAGLGGTCVFLNGTVGGLMTPLGITVTDLDGVDWSGDTFEKADALGRVLADLALQAVEAASPQVEPALSLRSTELFIPVENYAFQALFLIGLFERALYNYDPEADLDEDNQPEILTGIDVLRVGGIGMLTVPGELAPEVAIGGYDGSKVHTTEDTLIDPENENPPDLSAAPPGPYLKERLLTPFPWIIGLGNDEIGYLVPAYDYQLSESVPYLEEAPGHHYEETNSIGPAATPLIEERAALLLSWEP
ncbi:hypothetical protein L6R53_08080 [Myxococcota bacterium]|nr:hypothetical protein [Myxococcota bacterium]